MRATHDLLEALPANGLPTGHAGVASGPLINRDGDVFGRTVNLAARIADAAPDGRLWVTREVLLAIPSEATDVADVEATLQGIGDVALYDVARRVLEERRRATPAPERPRSAAVAYPARDVHETRRLLGPAVRPCRAGRRGPGGARASTSSR